MLRKRVTTRHFRLTRTRSWIRMILDTAATISGVSPGAMAVRRASSMSFGEQPVAEVPNSQMPHRRECSCVVTVDNETGNLVGFVRYDVLVQEKLEGQFGQRHLGGHALGVVCRGIPASSSPERAGVAFARRVLRSSKRKLSPLTVCTNAMVRSPSAHEAGSWNAGLASFDLVFLLANSVSRQPAARTA